MDFLLTIYPNKLEASDRITGPALGRKDPVLRIQDPNHTCISSILHSMCIITKPFCGKVIRCMYELTQLSFQRGVMRGFMPRDTNSLSHQSGISIGGLTQWIAE